MQVEHATMGFRVGGLWGMWSPLDGGQVPRKSAVQVGNSWVLSPVMAGRGTCCV